MAEPIVLPLFESAHEGFGDAVKVRDNRYHRIWGSIDARTPSQIKRGLRVSAEVSTVADNILTPPTFAVEWTYNSLPIVYYGAYDAIWSIQNAAVTKISISSLFVGIPGLTNVVTDGMLDDDGSGTSYLYVATVSGLVRMTIAQAVSLATTNIQANKLLSLNGYAYRSIGPVVGAAPYNQISICPPGSNRFTSSNWGAGVVAGSPTTSANAIIGVRQSAVVIKPEGILGYSQSLDEWVLYASWAGFAHPDNGKGARSFGDLALIPMGDGGLVIFDGYTAHSADPISVSSGATPSAHTTPTKITVVGATRHWALAATTHDSKVMVPDDLTFLVESPAATFTDASTSVKSSSYNSTANISAIGDGASRYIWIGSAFPFQAVKYMSQVDQYNADELVLSGATLSAAIGQTNGSYAAITIYDFTAKNDSEVFGQDGMIVLDQDPIINGLWAPTTVNSLSRYWLRLAVSGAIWSATRWRFCQVVPRYPSIDSNMPYEGSDRAGVIPHILIGDLASLQSDKPVWHDYASLTQPDAIGALIVSGPGGTNSAVERNLYAIGRRNVWKIELGPDRQSVDVMGSPAINGEGVYEAGAVRVSGDSDARLVSLYVDGFGFERASDDPFNFYYSWDDGEPWNVVHMGSGAVPPINVKRNDLSGGRMFRWAIGWQGTSGTFTSQAVITKVEATFMPTPGHSISRVRTTPTRI